MNSVVIVSGVRTAIGKFQGGLQTLSAPELAAYTIRENLKRVQLDPLDVQEVYMGQVLTAGTGQAPARQAAIFGGLSHNTPCTTINKVCGSGLKAVMLGAQSIMTKDNDIVVAGGMESMSRVPYLLDKARSGYRLGHGQITDGIIKDGLWDVYNNYHMGDAAELCAKTYQITKEAQDDFAIMSYERAQEAIKQGHFNREIVTISLDNKKTITTISQDEEPFASDLQKLKTLKPVFQKDGTITAGNASSLNDGAASLILMSEQQAQTRGLKSMGKIIGMASAALAPEWFSIAPAQAIEKVLKQTGLKVSDIDLFEVNQAFSVVSLAVAKKAELDLNKVDIYGGAVALGHPIGASGARILVTLLHALEQKNKKRGLATLCIGGGEAVAIVVERTSL